MADYAAGKKKIEFFESEEKEAIYYERARERIETVLLGIACGESVDRYAMFEDVKGKLKTGYGKKEIINHLGKDYGLGPDDSVSLISAAITSLQLEREKETYTYKRK